MAEKTYNRVRRLCDQGVMPEQKLDEAKAQYDASLATEKAAKSQYDMAKVTEIFPEVGELVGTGAPIMNIVVIDDNMRVCCDTPSYFIVRH